MELLIDRWRELPYAFRNIKNTDLYAYEIKSLNHNKKKLESLANNECRAKCGF
jgi:hypothetical protein